MKRMFLLFTSLLIVGLAVAQNKTVTGVVTDENNEPVIGASVVAKGTTIGTVTDLNGQFSLLVPPTTTTLVIKYLGMKDEEVAAATNVAVVLHPSSTRLDEVIVVAYGTTKKSNFTGSASTVKGKDIAKLQTGNISNALEGAAAGVQVASNSGQPGSGSSVRIRGIGSINASTSPLYVVDGVPFQGSINSLNSMDIESMTVLKDAAANSLYGSRASNGVILVTTKKGAEGKARVTLEARYGFNQRAIPQYALLDDPEEFYELTWEGLRNRQYYYIKNGWMESALYASNNLISQLGGYNNYDVADNMLVDIEGRINPNAQLRYKELWDDYMFKNGKREEYVTSVSGGDAKTNYYLSLGYLDDKGFVTNSDFERYTSRLRLTKDVNSWMKVGGNITYVRQTTNFVNENSTAGSNMFMVSQNMAPIYPVYLHDPATGKIVKDDKGNDIYDFGDDYGYARPISSMTNAVASQQLDMSQDISDIFDGKLLGEFKYKDLKLELNYAFYTLNNLGLEYLNGVYGQFKNSAGIASRYGERLQAQNANQLLTFNKTCAEKHNLDILIGHENYDYKYNVWSATKEKFLDPDQRELSGAIKNPLATSYENNYKVESYLSRLQYNLDEKYYLSAGFRRDGSSKFHKDHRWGNFYSAGASWRINKENFLSDAEWINDLKLKASYGTQGNDQIAGVLPWADQYSIANNNDNISLVFNYKGNTAITWESSETFNAGFDYSFFDQKLYGTVEYFYKNTSDMLYDRPAPASVGYTTYPDNIGDMVNQGVELEITAVLVRNNDFEWNVSFNGTHFKNEITALPPERAEDGITDGIFKLMVGKSRYEYYLPEYAGVDENGQAQWYMDVLDENEQETGERTTTTKYADATYYFQGSAIPDFYGGFGTYLKFKGIDFSVQTSYQVGGKGYDYAYSYMMAGNDLGRNMHKDLRNRWTPTHTNTDVPRIQMGNENTGSNMYSTRFFIDASYLNIKNITLGYELPKKLLNKLSIESLRIYGVADNIWLFSKRQGYDPRTSWSGQSSLGLYPAARTFSIGANLAF